MPLTRWTERHQEIAEYLSLRGVPNTVIARILSVHKNTVTQHLSHLPLQRADFHAQLLRDVEHDLTAVGVDMNHALSAVLHTEAAS